MPKSSRPRWPVIGVIALMTSICTPAAADTCPPWEAFKDRFVAPSGRVVDTANDDISHSEGQGYGLVLAQAHDDPGAFARIFEWTYSRLMIRQDGLLVWKWQPKGPDHYPDPNSASDGDLLVAYALLEAGEKFDNPDYTRRGEELARAIRDTLVREVGGYTVLLPGPEGFVHENDHVVISLAYWIFPALERLAARPDGAIWRELAEDGRKLLQKARFGRWNLPPDWVVLTPDGQLRLPEPDMFPGVFGYNAVRIPLYLRWGDTPITSELLAPFRDLWTGSGASGSLPLEVDLRSDEILSAGPNIGYAAVRRLVTGSPSAPTPDELGRALRDENVQYYGAVLSLLACLAEGGETSCGC
ncbi:glycosyl hydrolase family 8 [Rhodovibrio salinarum]|uniref:cellulase n=1 Tax=Rhodovibrio salinarum TaxID=1087 RepID=A0A934V0P4_9PROT|nr:glycosyl hydrolase family 8 [Rhodovibrio salinarum]MBK1698502.1 hypothetical protein [Rhodovibrio salinarum]